MQFDIIAISETYYNVDGYDAFRTVRSNRKGGGVVIYIKKKLNGRICETKSMVVGDVLDV